jgi:hypothetical protein
MSGRYEHACAFESRSSDGRISRDPFRNTTIPASYWTRRSLEVDEGQGGRPSAPLPWCPQLARCYGRSAPVCTASARFGGARGRHASAASHRAEVPSIAGCVGPDDSTTRRDSRRCIGMRTAPVPAKLPSGPTPQAWSGCRHLFFEIHSPPWLGGWRSWIPVWSGSSAH